MTSNQKKLLAVCTALFGIFAFFVVSHLSVPNNQVQKLGGTNQKFVGMLPAYLSGSGITSSITTIGVQSLTLQQSGYKLTMSDFGSAGYATLEPGQSSRQEFVSFTGITQNSNGTAVLTGVSRGLAPISPYTASTTYAFSHGGGTSLIISNSPPFYNNFVTQGNDASIVGQYTFASTSLPQVATNTTNAQISAATNTLATVAYAQSLANAGGANATEGMLGFVQLATALQQASSTATGSSGASLDMRAKYATDTPQAACAVGYSIAGAGCSLVAQLTGKIRSTWIDFTANYSWTGAHTFSGATTTISSPFVLSSATSSGLLKYYGDGSDGSLVISATTTLTRDMQYTNLTINSNTGINTNGFRIFVQGTLTVNGLIDHSGGNAGNASGITGGTASIASAQGTVAGGGAGGFGGNGGTYIGAGGAGGAGTSMSNRFLGVGLTGAAGVAGGNCGTPVSTQSSGGGGGVGTTATSTINLYPIAFQWFDYNGIFNAASSNGGGGGGGGSETAGGTGCGVGGGGGGSGGNGGVIWISANVISISSTGTIVAKGGNGGNGGQCSGNSTGASGSGGTGGNGGFIVIFYGYLSNSGTIAVSGGTAGTEGGGSCVGGNNGSTGTTGTIKYF